MIIVWHFNYNSLVNNIISLHYNMITIEKINNKVVKPVKLNKTENKDIKGGDIAGLYANIFICARKMSGKTSLINTLLKQFIVKDTEVIIFASTVEIDPTWKQIVKSLEKKGNNVITYPNIVDDGINQVAELTNYLQEGTDSDSEPEVETTHEYNEQVGGYQIVTKEMKKKKKPKLIGPEYIIVFDDLSTQLRDPAIDYLLKRNRHMKMKTIISSQFFHDLSPSSRTQIDILIIFGKMPITKLKYIHKEADLPVDLDVFLDIYVDATAEPYNFLMINTRTGEMRKNLNMAYQIKS